MSGTITDKMGRAYTGTVIGDKFYLDTTGGSGPLAVIVDEPSAGVTYVGKAAIASATSAASWQIIKMVESGTTTTITWADGNSSFDNIWNNRAALSYS